MSLRALATALTATSLIALAAGPALSQPKTAYKAPRTSYGQPDLQGIWTNATITPVMRPAKYGDRNVLTKAEADALEKANADQVARADAPTPPDATVGELKNADCGADGISGFNCGYNQGWKDPGTALIDINGEEVPILDGSASEFCSLIESAGLEDQGGHVDEIIIENLFASDLAFLQDLYRRINQEGHTEAAVTCPACDHEFAVDIAGDAPGGS